MEHKSRVVLRAFIMQAGGLVSRMWCLCWNQRLRADVGYEGGAVVCCVLCVVCCVLISQH